MVVGIPLYVLLEGRGEAFLSERILVGVVVILAFYGTVYLVWQVINMYIRSYFSHSFG